MGALLAGVFCGVLRQVRQWSAGLSLISQASGKEMKGGKPYGATGGSGRLFLMGSAMAEVV